MPVTVDGRKGADVGEGTASPELGVAGTLGILSMPNVATQRSSTGLGWSRMYLSVQEEAPYSADFRGVDNHLLILHLDGPVTVTRGKGPTRRRKVIGAGGLFLHPAGRDLSVELGGPLRTMHLYIDDALVQDSAGRTVTLAEELGSQDPLLEQLMLSLDKAVQQQRGPASRLYVDTLGAALAAQLADGHATRRGHHHVQPRTTGLADREFRITTELMHERISTGVSLSELARAVGLSESQFTRAFKARTGQPPHRYLMGLRLEQAQRLLRTSELSLVEVASASGFGNQEHMTRVMRARLDVTPGALRRSVS